VNIAPSIDEAIVSSISIDVGHLDRLAWHPLEIRRMPHVGRVRRPGEELAFGHVERAPFVVAAEDVRVGVGELLRTHRRRDRVADLLRARPDVVQEDVVAVRVLPDRLDRPVDVHAAGERVGDDERR